MNRYLWLIWALPFVCLGQSDSIQMGFKSDRELLEELPLFSIYGDNYFITGTNLGETPSTANSDAKFQLGFKQLLTNIELPWNVIPFFTYRQVSFWNIYKESSPFRETNYNPALGFAKLWFKKGRLSHGIWLQFEHESNGREGMDSRSWNMLSARFSKPLGKRWQFFLKGWIPVGSLEDNPDITSYRGYFQMDVSHKLNDRIYVEAAVRNAVFDSWRGSLNFSLSYKVFKSSNQFIYVQYFGGFSEDLIDYDASVGKIRIGVVFKELFANFE